MPRGLPKVKPAGLIVDLPADELPNGAVTRYENIEMIDGSPHQARPFASVFGTGLGQPRYLLPNQERSNAFWIYACDQEVNVTDGASHWDISPAGLTDVSDLTSPFTGGVIEQLPVLNNRQDGPFWWNQATGTPMQALPDWPAGDLCESMRPFRGYLVAMNIFSGGSRIKDLLRWSDVAAPGDIPRSWTPAPDTQAGEVSVSFNPGGLVDGRQLLDRFYLYKTSSVYLLQLVAGVFVFANRPAFSTFGALTRNCIVEWRGQHIVLTDGDLIMHDGVTVTSLAANKVRREIFNNIDGDNAENTYLVLETDTNLLYVCSPMTGEKYPTTALILNLESGEWSRRQLISADGTPHTQEGLVNVAASPLQDRWVDRTTTWATDATRWNAQDFQRTSDFLLLADYTDSEFVLLGSGNDLDGDPLEAIVERDGLTLGEPELRKYIGQVWPKLRGTLGAQVGISVGAHDDVNVAPQWSPELLFTIGVDEYLNFDQFAIQGYFLAYRYRAIGQLRWSLPSFDVQPLELGDY